MLPLNQTGFSELRSVAGGGLGQDSVPWGCATLSLRPHVLTRKRGFKSDSTRGGLQRAPAGQRLADDDAVQVQAGKGDVFP